MKLRNLGFATLISVSMSGYQAHGQESLLIPQACESIAGFHYERIKLDATHNEIILTLESRNELPLSSEVTTALFDIGLQSTNHGEFITKFELKALYTNETGGSVAQHTERSELVSLVLAKPTVTVTLMNSVNGTVTQKSTEISWANFDVVEVTTLHANEQATTGVYGTFAWYKDGHPYHPSFKRQLACRTL